MREKGTFVVSLFLLAGLAGGSYWLSERARLSDPTVRKLTHDPDYFATNFRMTRMDDKGNALYALAAQGMTHYPDDDSTDLVLPAMTSAKPDQPLVHVRSDTGHMTSDGQQIRLNGNVSLNRAQTATSAALIATGSTMLLYPERDVAVSELPVHIIKGGSLLDAANMSFDNGTRTLLLNENSHVRGTAILEARSLPTEVAAPVVAAPVVAAPATALPPVAPSAATPRKN